ncbi:MAG TPA: T9SS type A sorting domain-containing protein [Bacteroidia bacterium]|nr:T9SS type A sorting domain-containing protein [Bacteroidia bacterium]
MKRIFTILILSVFTIPTFAQILVQTDFATYNGLPAGVPPGWFIYWNDTAASHKSFYTGPSTCGIACPAYKFGWDSIYVITPAFANADSVRFYMKGNGTFQANRFQVWGAPDTTNWTLIQENNNVSATASIVTLPLNSNYTHVKFAYLKDSLGYNVGFDDVYVFAGSFSGISEHAVLDASIYPNPTQGKISVDMAHFSKSLTVTVSNILGKVVKQVVLNTVAANYEVDLNDLEDGVYMVNVRNEFGEKTQRVVLKK